MIGLEKAALHARRTTLAWLVLLLLSPTTAAASPLFELVGDPAGGGGFVGRYGAASAASAYFNPALLPQAPSGLSVGAFVLSDQIGITAYARPGDDSLIARGAEGAFLDADTLDPVFPSPIPTAWLEYGCQDDCNTRGAGARPRQAAGSSDNVHAYVPVGFVLPLAGGRVTAGFSGMFPVGDMTTTSAFYNDEREQYFSNSLHPELYGDRLTTMSMAVGLGLQLTDWLSLGISGSLNLSNEADASNFVPEASRFDALQISNGVKVQSRLAPHFAAVLTPNERLQLTLTLHTPQAFEVRARFSTLLPDGTQQFASRSFIHAYQPLTMGVGGNAIVWAEGAHMLSVIAGAKLANWSSYRDRHDGRPQGEAAWKPTVTPSLGARYGFDAHQIALDMTYAPSPVPEQTGRANYVDNDRLGGNLAYQVEFEALDMPWRFGLSTQLHRLISRQHRKDPSAEDPVIDEVPDTAVDKRDLAPVTPRDGLQTNNPGYPGFSSRGWLWGGGLSLALLM